MVLLTKVKTHLNKSQLFFKTLNFIAIHGIELKDTGMQIELYNKGSPGLFCP
jgi:hypothetical protein